jgi:hypothetical protein
MEVRIAVFNNKGLRQQDKNSATPIKIIKLNGWEYGKAAPETKFLVSLWEKVSINDSKSLFVCQ